MITGDNCAVNQGKSPGPSEDAQNPLEAALLEAIGDPSGRGGFYQSLMDSDLYLVGRLETVEGKSKEGTVTAEPGDRLVLWPRGEDSRIHAYTSLARLRSSIGQSKVPYVGLPSDVLFAAVDPDVDVVLNEGVWFGKQIVPEERRLLVEGTIPGRPEEIQIAEGAEVLLGQPADYPRELVDALRREFARHGGVAEARLAQLHVPSTGQPPHPVVGLRAQGGPGALNAILDSIGPAVQGAVPPGMPVDFVDLDGAGAGEYLRAESVPFFKA